MQNETPTAKDVDPAPGLGEREEVPGGVSVGDSVPEMPPPGNSPGGGLTADDIAQPTTTADTTGDRATGLTALRD